VVLAIVFTIQATLKLSVMMMMIIPKVGARDSFHGSHRAIAPMQFMLAVPPGHLLTELMTLVTKKSPSPSTIVQPTIWSRDGDTRSKRPYSTGLRFSLTAVTIRDAILTCTRSKADTSQLNLPHGTDN